jgi:hypothetical protein
LLVSGDVWCFVVSGDIDGDVVILGSFYQMMDIFFGQV